TTMNYSNVLEAHEVKTALAISQDMVSRALRTAYTQPAKKVHTDTPHRRRMRALLEGAGWAEAPVLCAFFKEDGTLRYMQCEAVPGADRTARYVTVSVLEASQAAVRAKYRRVCLDTLVGVAATYHA